MATENNLKDVIRCTDAQHSSLVAGRYVSGATYTEGNIYLVEAPDILTLENTTGNRVIPTIKSGSKAEKVELGNSIAKSGSSLVCTGHRGHSFYVSIDTEQTTRDCYWTFWLLHGDGTTTTVTLDTRNSYHHDYISYDDIIAYKITAKGSTPPYDTSISSLIVSGYFIDFNGELEKAEWSDILISTTDVLRMLLTDVEARLTVEYDT